VTLDAGDNDPIRLWTCVASAVDRIRNGLGRPALQRLRVAGVSLETVVDELVNGIASFPGPMVAVLDDLQAVVEWSHPEVPSPALRVCLTRVNAQRAAHKWTVRWDDPGIQQRRLKCGSG
jgi:ATP/maltotriose-dependent transcriptional regulator MalT